MSAFKPIEVDFALLASLEKSDNGVFEPIAVSGRKILFTQLV
jgi:hypothetical protein